MKKECPKCQSDNVIPIVYGLPSSEAGDDEKKGLIRLGGCDMDESSPQWHCKNCGYEF